MDAALAALDVFDPQSIEVAVRSTADARGGKAASLIHALRVAITGKTVRPGLVDVLALLGRTGLRERIAEARRILSPSRS